MVYMYIVQIILENSTFDNPEPSLFYQNKFPVHCYFTFDKIDKFEQPFFDAVYRTETYYNSENEKLSEKSVEIFGQDLNIKNNNVDFKKVRQVLSEKYMPKNRAKQLLSQMPIDQSVFTEVVKWI